MHASNTYRRIEQAILYLVKHRDQRPSLADLAAHLQASPFHIQRLFKRWAGVTPKQFQQYLTAAHARACLRDSAPVLDAAFRAGLSGPGRLHDLLVSTDAVTPGQVRSGGDGLALHYGVHETPLGPARIVVSRRGIVALAFLDGPDPDHAQELATIWPAAEIEADPARTLPLIQQIFTPAGAPQRRLPLRPRGTNLQLRVWEALLTIPEGHVTSYGALARALGRPRAARAVANAVAANPIAYLIPCHRVLRASGHIGGYRWGTARKRALLLCEQRSTSLAAPR